LTRIFLIRHAESEGNTYRRAHGHFNGQITENGHKQINQLRDRFTNEQIDVIYSSDLDRTCTTATALSEPRNLDINKTEKLREVNLGVWENVPWADLEANEPKMLKCFNWDPAKWSVEGSESYESVQNRMLACINEIGKKHDGETVAVFSHGFAIRALLCKLLNLESNNTLPYCDNTAVALFIYDNGLISIEYHCDNSHLTDKTSTLARQDWWREIYEKIE